MKVKVKDGQSQRLVKDQLPRAHISCWSPNRQGQSLVKVQSNKVNYIQVWSRQWRTQEQKLTGGVHVRPPRGIDPPPYTHVLSLPNGQKYAGDPTVDRPERSSPVNSTTSTSRKDSVTRVTPHGRTPQGVKTTRRRSLELKIEVRRTRVMSDVRPPQADVRPRGCTRSTARTDVRPDGDSRSTARADVRPEGDTRSTVRALPAWSFKHTIKGVDA